MRSCASAWFRKWPFRSPYSNLFGVGADLAVGVSSSVEVCGYGASPPARFSCIGGGLASDDKLEADQHHILGVLRKVAGLACGVPAWASKFLTPAPPTFHMPPPCGNGDPPPPGR